MPYDETASYGKQTKRGMKLEKQMEKVMKPLPHSSIRINLDGVIIYYTLMIITEVYKAIGCFFSKVYALASM